MTYFTYRQNNSGGSFNLPAISVVIKAETASEAETIALANGIYFDPMFEIDCECCGNRWFDDATASDDIPAVSQFEIDFAKWDGIPAQIVIA